MLMLVASIPFSGLLAQTNTLSGSLINGPGSSAQAIPSRTVKLEFFTNDNGEDPPLYSAQTDKTSSNDYSFTYSGGPIFIYDGARVFVDLDSVPNPNADLSCIKSSDLVVFNDYLQGNITLTNLQKVAADVNIDGVINLTDRNMLRDVLLSVILKFDNSLTVAGKTYPDRTMVYPTVTGITSVGAAISYSSSYEFSGLSIPSGTSTGYDFYSVRLGDLNGSCTTYNAFSGGGTNFEKRQTTHPGFSSNSLNKFQVGPNPFNSSISIVTDTPKLKTVFLFDLNGREIIRQEATGSNLILLENKKIRDIPSGTYILHLVDNNGSVSSHKLLKR